MHDNCSRKSRVHGTRNHINNEQTAAANVKQGHRVERPDRKAEVRAGDEQGVEERGGGGPGGHCACLEVLQGNGQTPCLRS